MKKLSNFRWVICGLLFFAVDDLKTVLVINGDNGKGNELRPVHDERLAVDGDGTSGPVGGAGLDLAVQNGFSGLRLVVVEGHNNDLGISDGQNEHVGHTEIVLSGVQNRDGVVGFVLSLIVEVVQGNEQVHGFHSVFN